jgi:chromosome segregation ATPase
VHVLTKIFIVLVSLLAVLLVPLVVVYAHNEDSFKSKYDQAVVQATVARGELEREQSRRGAVEAKLQGQLQEKNSEIRILQDRLAQKEDEVSELQRRVVAAEGLQSEINSKLATLASSVDAGQQLTGGLIGELRDLRGSMVQKERRLVELDEALRDRSGQLEVANAAVRALREELQRLNEEHARAMNDLQQYAIQYGALSDRRESLDEMSIPPDRDLRATIISVRRSSDQVLAEIDAGSRDGVKLGWSMTIDNGAGTFIGNLRIIEVDINRATGIVSLENPSRGVVEVNQKVRAVAGHR